MAAEIIKLIPHFTHNIWGGSKLRELFGYDVEGNDIGECWGIAAHPDGESTICGGEYDGMTLSKLWNDYPNLFGRMEQDKNPFPLLVKIIDAKEDLSIQVHPDDDYAKKNESGSLGKMECWYILDCDEDSTLVIGHHANTKVELEEYISEGWWDKFVREVPIKKGDFIQINPGTVHAIKGGVLLLETQQNSNITYRVYDYDRLSNGCPRPLHVQQSLEVIDVPGDVCDVSHMDEESNTLNELYDCKYYCVYSIPVDGRYEFKLENPYMLMSVVEGTGSINGLNLELGDHFVVCGCDEPIVLDGNLKIIASIAN